MALGWRDLAIELPADGRVCLVESARGYVSGPWRWEAGQGGESGDWRGAWTGAEASLQPPPGWPAPAMRWVPFEEVMVEGPAEAREVQPAQEGESLWRAVEAAMPARLELDRFRDFAKLHKVRDVRIGVGGVSLADYILAAANEIEQHRRARAVAARTAAVAASRRSMRTILAGLVRLGKGAS